jgi:hypothetical protein
MPICHRPTEREDRDDEQDNWREPPGYLGEAVRRAKAIGRVMQQPPHEEALSAA